MASTGPPTWRWPPIDASRPSLGSSSVSLSTLFLHDPIRRFTVARRLPRSSTRDPPPSIEHQKIDADLEFLSPEVVEKGWKQSMGATPVAREAEIFAPLSRRQRARLRLNSIQRRPLWKRIVFASKKVRSIILLNVITVIYASDIPVLKEVEQLVDPALFTVVRFALTAVPFLPFMLKAHGDSQTRSAGMELGFWVSLGYLSQALGLLTSEAGRASFISALTIIVVPFIDGIFGATVPAMTWSGALLSLVGVAMLEYGGSPCVGDILNLLSAVFFGIHILRTEQISRSTKKTKFLALLGYEIFVVALSSAIWFIFQKYLIDGEGVSLGSCTWSYLWDSIISFPWIPAMYTGIFSAGLCLLVEMNAMCDVSATETAIIYGLEPVWGSAFAWFCLGERWGTSTWIGAFLVICGSLAVQILGETGKSGSNMERSNEQKDFSLSTVPVNTRKNDSHLFRKQDKL
ncbi:uncharacterized protein LOC110096315 isoform X2 [Dendrobium catenatum]|uniref:EamA domain-containing protein n=1 Tax=Dendrobium catenatum TaxID=906689 RepID=A0A2I0WU29_9ASPA|nr:uncharacterized protein LOC110096315 isoform X2 [Dendrobium catenatum]PKU79174.1 hypothetical protein MA16_Dca000518 [Dendrobium catenatum]